MGTRFALILIAALVSISDTSSNAESLEPIDMAESEWAETNLDDIESSTNTWLRDRLLHELLLERHPLPNTDQLLLEDFLWSGTEGEAEFEDDPSPNSLSSSHFRPVPKTLSPEFLLRTVLRSNLSILNSDIQEFRQSMEQRLAKAYTTALQRKLADKKTLRRIKRDELNALNNEDGPNISTHIHNIRSALPPEPRVELIYSVHQDGKPLKAGEAVSVLCQLSVSDMESLLEHEVETRAEMYTKSSTLSSMTMTKAARSAFNETTTGWMWVVMACLISILLLLTLLTLLVLIKRWRSPYTRSLLAGSPEHGSNNGGEESKEMDKKMDKKRDLEENYEIDFGLKGAPEPKQLEGANTVFQANILAGMKSDKLEFNTEKHKVSPEVIPRRPKPNRRMRLQSTSSSNSAFPVRTTPATSLAPLREEFSDPNESNNSENSFTKDKKWPFVNRGSTSSSGSNVDSSSSSETLATQMAEMATQTEGKSNKESGATTRIGRRKRPNRIDPASTGSRSRVHTRSTSATSADVQADLAEDKKQRFLQTETRRHSSTTPVTPSSDPTFAMRQRHWEIFAQGKKQSHHGRLLPGSSTSEEERNGSGDEQTVGGERPLIDAIKKELTKFDRQPRQNEEEEDQGPTEV